MISAFRFCERRCRSLDIPRASPVKSITRHTPSATPAALTTARTGRWRTLAVTRLSIRVRGRPALKPRLLLLRVQVPLGQVRGVLEDEDFGVVLLVDFGGAGVLEGEPYRVV